MRNFSRVPSPFPQHHYGASVPSVLVGHVGSSSSSSSFLRAIVICFNYGGCSSSLPFSWVLVFPPSIPYSLDSFFNSPKLALLNSNALIGLPAFWLCARSHQVSEMPAKAELSARLHAPGCARSLRGSLPGRGPRLPGRLRCCGGPFPQT